VRTEAGQLAADCDSVEPIRGGSRVALAAPRPLLPPAMEPELRHHRWRRRCRSPTCAGRFELKRRSDTHSSAATARPLRSCRSAANTLMPRWARPSRSCRWGRPRSPRSWRVRRVRRRRRTGPPRPLSGPPYDGLRQDLDRGDTVSVLYRIGLHRFQRTHSEVPAGGFYRKCRRCGLERELPLPPGFAW